VELLIEPQSLGILKTLGISSRIFKLITPWDLWPVL